ncbi:MAG: membrane-bound PQQ-dependent dehydrogenase, glucose/quinate/shikimate family [Rhodanobacteraceae bacterium]
MSITRDTVHTRRWHWAPLSGGIVLVIIGLYFVIGGVYLLTLGGTPYYLLAGIGLLLTGVGLGFARGWSLWIYFIVLLGTLVWAVVEVGFKRFGLAPRLWLPIAIGIYLMMPWVSHRLNEHRGVYGLGLVVLAGIVICTFPWFIPRGIHGTMASRDFTPAPTPLVSASDWIYYGRTARGDRYSPLDQVNTSDVTHLKLAWQAHTGDMPKHGENGGGGGGSGKEFNFEDTPIEVNDTLYVCTGHHWVEAFDAATGKMKWKFKPDGSDSSDQYHSCRGVAYYAAPPGTATACPRRIIAPTGDARLFAVNADSGKLCPDFGNAGYVNLKQYLGNVPPGFHFITSQPLVIGDRVITGGWIYDNIAENEPSGAVRAFDPVTGKLIWAWDLGRPPGQQVVHASDLTNGRELTRGTPNAWGTYTADPKLGLVYLPLGNATPDYYGGHRRSFDDEYNSSIVALDYETGAPRWHFQTTHHDLWDFDLPIGPSLVNLPGPDGTTIPALVQTTKRGQLFMLNRETGKPIAKVVEEKVPTDVLPGDRISSTQPYSVGMPSLTPPYLKESQLWGGTPIDQMLCHIQYKQAYYEGHFTPPQAKKTLVYPAYDGVIDWMGASIDPRNLVLIANTNYIPFMVTLIPREKAEKNGWVKPWTDRSKAPPKTQHNLASMYGTPYVAKVEPWMNPWWIPCNPPPWGKLVAIDLVTRKIIWERPLGTTRDNGPWHIPFNFPMQTGVFNIGGNLITRGGLIFVGATSDDFIRAFDERTGQRLWQARLPAGGQATPMTYKVNGRQYIAIAAGGHGGLGTKTGDDIMVYALPQNTAARSR